MLHILVWYLMLSSETNKPSKQHKAFIWPICICFSTSRMYWCSLLIWGEHFASAEMSGSATEKLPCWENFLLTDTSAEPVPGKTFGFHVVLHFLLPPKKLVASSRRHGRAHGNTTTAISWTRSHNKPTLITPTHWAFLCHKIITIKMQVIHIFLDTVLFPLRYRGQRAACKWLCFRNFLPQSDYDGQGHI